MIGIIVSGGISFIFVLFSTYLGVNYFKSKSIGQEIQEELQFHDHKKGNTYYGWDFYNSWNMYWLFSITY